MRFGVNVLWSVTGLIFTLIFLSLPAFAQDAAQNEIVFRFFRDGIGHFYTTDCTEAEFAAGEYQFKYEGQAFAVRKQQSPGTVPLYRFLYGNFHFYTTSSDAEGHPSFRPEGILGYIYKETAPGLLPLYRSFNPASGDHFYTINEEEYNSIANIYSGDRFVVGYVSPQGIQTCTPTQARFIDRHRDEGPSANFFAKVGRDVISDVRQIFTPSRTENAPQRVTPARPSGGAPSGAPASRAVTYYALMRVSCQDSSTGVDRADTTTSYPSQSSHDDAAFRALRDPRNFCSVNGDDSRVETSGTRRIMD